MNTKTPHKTTIYLKVLSMSSTVFLKESVEFIQSKGSGRKIHNLTQKVISPWIFKASTWVPQESPTQYYRKQEYM